MTPSELKQQVEQSSDSHFFTRRTMQFFGDTMANYGVRGTFILETMHDETTGKPRFLEVWELYRKKPVKHDLMGSAYFCKATFRRVFKKDEA